MPEYTVQWMIELTAETPEDAARQALAIQRDPDSLATHFTVIGEDGVITDVDDAQYEDSCGDCGTSLSVEQAKRFAWALFVAANGGNVTPQHPITDVAFLANSLNCPVCGLGDTVGEEIEIQGDDTVQEVCCNDCGARWFEVYKLVGYEIRSKEDDDVEQDD